MVENPLRTQVIWVHNVWHSYKRDVSFSHSTKGLWELVRTTPLNQHSQILLEVLLVTPWLIKFLTFKIETEDSLYSSQKFKMDTILSQLSPLNAIPYHTHCGLFFIFLWWGYDHGYVQFGPLAISIGGQLTGRKNH